MAYARKTTDVWEVWSNYGYGWEAECTGENLADARRLLREYNENAPQGQHKLRHRRIKKEAQ
jgi:hypothetical protein